MLLFSGLASEMGPWRKYRQQMFPDYAIRNLKVVDRVIPADEYLGTPEDRELTVTGDLIKLPKKTLARVQRIKVQRQRRAMAQNARDIKGVIAGKW